MSVVLDPGASATCAEACQRFSLTIETMLQADFFVAQDSSTDAFPTARQLSTVYGLFLGEDLSTLLEGYSTQATAMAMLFDAAGGLIEAQDEALAAALSKAAAEPAGLQSVGLIHGGGPEGFILDDQCVMGGYGRVGPEDVSSSPLEYIAQCSEALQPQQYLDIQTKATAIAEGLSDAATTLQGELNAVLGHGWQGEFAENATYSTRGLVQSAHALSESLRQVAGKAAGAHDGFEATRTTIAEYAAQGQVATRQAAMANLAQGPADGGAAMDLARAEAKRQAAEEQARAIVNTTYSPSVMDANLDDIDFTSAYRVVSGTALGGPTGVDMARIWNTDDLPRPAPAAAPNAAAAAAYSGAAPGEAGVSGAGAAVASAGGVGMAGPVPSVDATTEQALLASRGADGAAAMPAASGAGAGAGTSAGGGAGGVNAATTAAGAPFAPVATGNGGQGGAAGGAGRGSVRGRESSRDRDRGQGFGNAAGLIGGGGAAAAGAGAMRMGGAGTLAGLGSGGSGMIAGSPGPGAGSVPGATAGAGGAGAVSSSSGGAAAGRAGGMPIGGMMGAANAGQNSDKPEHTPASYLVNATNTTAIIGEPLKVSPAVIGRRPDPTEGTADAAAGATESAAAETTNGARGIRGIRGIIGLG